MVKVVLVNDTSQYNSHFGTQLVGQTFREQFARTKMRLIGAIGRDVDKYNALLKRADLVVINGEGSVHHGRNLEIVRLASSYPCALVNAVWQENPQIDELHEMKYVAVRESMSADALREQGINCEVIPDVSFASMLLGSFVRGRPRQDMAISDSVDNTAAGMSPFTETPFHFLRQLGQCRRACLGRFHAIVAASVLQIPFSAFASNTHKIEGMLRDMNIPHCFAATQQQAIQLCPSEFDPHISDYVQHARSAIRQMFESLYSLASAR